MVAGFNRAVTSLKYLRHPEVVFENYVSWKDHVGLIA